MKTVRLTATTLFYLSRMLSLLYFLIAAYAGTVLLLYRAGIRGGLPISVSGDLGFEIFYPFTHKPFLIGDYTAAYLVTTLLTVVFYAFFLWLLGNVFQTFRQERLFTLRGVIRLARFYRMNLVLPLAGLLLLALWGQETKDMLVITLLHGVIGVFAFFMAAIFRQGLVLQEEQDLTF